MASGQAFATRRLPSIQLSSLPHPACLCFLLQQRPFLHAVALKNDMTGTGSISSFCSLPCRHYQFFLFPSSSDYPSCRQELPLPASSSWEFCLPKGRQFGRLAWTPPSHWPSLGKGRHTHHLAGRQAGTLVYQQQLSPCPFGLPQRTGKRAFYFHACPLPNRGRTLLPLAFTL